MDHISLSHNTTITVVGSPHLKRHEGSSTSQSGSDRQNKEDRVTLSEEGKKLSDKNQANSLAKELTEQELQKVEDLKARDREVRAHEQAHMVAAGQHAQGGPKYDMTRGPDGRSYAIGGHVSVDISKESSPEETVAKMRIILKAALAPINPSSADRQVAAQASMIEQQAISEINQASIEENKDNIQQVDAKEQDNTIKTETAENSPSINTAGNVAQFQQNDPEFNNIKPLSIFA